MKKLVVGMVVLGAVAALMAVAPQNAEEQEIAQLRADLANLGLRVDRLEHAGGSTGMSAGADASAKPAVASQTMILVSVSQSAHTDDNSDEIDRLKRESDSLMNTVNQYADKANADAGQARYAGRSSAGERGWGQAAGSSVVSTNVGSVGRQVIGDKQTENRYSTLAYIKREKLKKLQAANAELKQLLHGHDAGGKVIFTLHTKHDLTKSLNDISIGDTVTWTGNRLDASTDAETWVITSIHKVN